MPIKEQQIPIIKADQGVSDPTGTLVVVFTEPFPDNKYSVSIMTGIFALCRVPRPTRTANGFTVKTYDISGGSLGSVPLTWTAVQHLNT